MTVLLLDVVLAFDTNEDEHVKDYKPPEKLWRHFRQIKGDEGYEAKCEFIGGRHRTVRGLLTLKETCELLAVLDLRWAGREADRLDDGYDDSLDLANCLYFTAVHLSGYTVAFVALPTVPGRRETVKAHLAQNPRLAL